VKLQIDYFAVLREQAGKDRELLRTSGATTPAEVYALLSRQYGFDLGQARLKVAVNDEFTDWSRQLRDGDRLVFIPPVAGG
jgi:molybdopterin converting factor subunit 1